MGDVTVSAWLPMMCSRRSSMAPQLRQALTTDPLSGRKLQLASRTQAALYALREGLASLDDADQPPPRLPVSSARTGQVGEEQFPQIGV